MRRVDDKFYLDWLNSKDYIHCGLVDQNSTAHQHVALSK